MPESFFKKVLLYLDWYDQEICRGVAECCREHGLTLNQTYTFTRIQPTHMTFDGIICGFSRGKKKHNQFLLDQPENIPMVNIDEITVERECPQVLTDDQRIGQLQAEHLLACGYQTFIYAGSHVGYHIKRYQSFRDTLNNTGCDCHLLFLQDFTDHDELVHWITGKGEVIGIAGSDIHALTLIELLSHHNIKIPHEVGIIGADNRADIYDFTPQATLTSVDTNLYQLGYQATLLLINLFQGYATPPPPVSLIPPAGVIKRESTSRDSLQNDDMALALKIARTQYHTPIQAKDLLVYAKCSWPTLCKEFQKATGRNPSDYLTHLRVKKAKKLLAETDLKTYDIAEQCGYQGNVQFLRAFKRVTGINCTEYKQSLSGNQK